MSALALLTLHYQHGCMDRASSAPAPYVPTAYRPGTPLADKIARENAEVRRSIQREAARRSALYGSPQPRKGADTPSTPESADAEENKSKGKSRAESTTKDQNGPRGRRKPGEAPLLGPRLRVYGVMCPRCQAHWAELCHTSSGDFRPVWEPHRGREKRGLGDVRITDRKVRPLFEQALTAWERGTSSPVTRIVTSSRARGLDNSRPQAVGRQRAKLPRRGACNPRARAGQGSRGAQGLHRVVGVRVLHGVQGVAHGLRAGEAAVTVLIGPDIACTAAPRKSPHLPVGKSPQFPHNPPVLLLENADNPQCTPWRISS